MEFFRVSFPEAAVAYDAEQAKTRARREVERFVRRVFIKIPLWFETSPSGGAIRTASIRRLRSQLADGAAVD